MATAGTVTFFNKLSSLFRNFSEKARNKSCGKFIIDCGFFPAQQAVFTAGAVHGALYKDVGK
ncbi:hypothetical protein [Comamonas sp.]